MSAMDDDRTAAQGGFPPTAGTARRLIVSKAGPDRAEFDRLARALRELPGELRWVRRAGRLVLVVEGLPADDRALQMLAGDPAVAYVLKDPSPEEVSRLLSRRDLLNVALATTGALVTACVAGTLAFFVRAPARERSPRGDHYVGRADAIPVGGAQARVVDGEDVLVIRRDELHFHALAATCTHSEVCLVEWDARRGQLVCPCHRGVYDLYGNVVSGPPPRPLPRREVVVRDGEVWLRRAPG